MFGGNLRRLETLAVVAALLHVTDRRAEERRAVLLRDGQQRDLAVEADELLDDQFADVAPRALATVVPGSLHLVGRTDHRLALARRRHQRLDHARVADPVGRLAKLLERPGVEVAGRLQSQLLGSQVADRLAVHREVDGTGTRDDLDPLALEVVEAFGADRLDLRDDDVRAVFGNGGRKGLAIQHVEDFAGIGHLHGRCSDILVARNDRLAQSLGRNHELLAQFARAQKQYLFHLCGGFGFFDYKDRIFSVDTARCGRHSLRKGYSGIGRERRSIVITTCCQRVIQLLGRIETSQKLRHLTRLVERVQQLAMQKTGAEARLRIAFTCRSTAVKK